MRLDIAIPAYNEEGIITSSLKRVLDFCSVHLADYDWKLSVLINGSSDSSAKLAHELALNNPRLRVAIFPEGGRGRTLKKHWLATDAEILSYMDIDLAVDLEALPRLLSPLINESHDISIGCRFHPEARVARSWFRECSSRIYSRLARLILKQPYKDLQCGFKAIRGTTFKKIAEHVKDKAWFFDTELIAHGHSLGFRIAEIPVNWAEARFMKRKTKVNFLKIALDFIVPLLRLRHDIIKTRKHDKS